MINEYSLPLEDVERELKSSHLILLTKA